MSAALNKMLSEISFRIPREILNIAFTDRNNFNNIVTTLDDKISTEVIRKKVMVDLNLASQEALYIPLDYCTLLYQDSVKTAFYIPKSRTNGRSIVSVLGMLSGYHIHGDALYTNINDIGVSSTLNSSVNIMNSLENVNIRQTARIDLIGENTILIDEGLIENLATNIHVIVENDANLNNINPRSYMTLANVAVLATKAYIYNTMVVQINKGQLYSGHELSVIKDIVDEYKDAEEQYQEYYNTVVKKVMFMNNEKTFNAYITSMFGNTI